MRNFIRSSVICLLLLVGISAVSAASNPSGNILDDTPQFIVDNIEGTEWYQLEVVAGGGVIYEEWIEAIGCGALATCALDAEVNVGAGLGDVNGSWRARPWNSETGIGDWSAPTPFTLLAPQVLDVTFPATYSPNYRIAWLADDDGQRPDLYRLVVLNADQGTIRLDIWTPPATCSEDGVDYCILYPYPDPFLVNGNYTVYVQAFTYDVGFSAWSEGVDFTINSLAPQMPEDVSIGQVYENVDMANPCEPAAGVQGNACLATTLSFRVDYDDSQAEWMELHIEELMGDVVFSTWIQIDGSTFCISEGFCNIQVPVVFEYDQTYTWRARIWNPYGGLSQYTVPGGGASGDPGDNGVFTVVEPQIITRGN